MANLFVRVTANAATAASTVTSRVGGVNGNLSVSIGAGLTGAFEDTVNTDSLVDGNLVNYQIVVGAGGSLTCTIFSCTLATAVNTTPILIADSSTTGIPANTTAYFAIGGHLERSSTEAYTQYTLRVAATLSNFRVVVLTNARADATTVRVRVNGANGNQSVSIDAAATGTFEDTVNTDSLASGDSINYVAITGAGAGSIALTIMQVKSTSSGRQVISGHPGAGTLAAGLTRYLTLEGSCQEYATTEADTQRTLRIDFTARNMFVRIIANSVDGASTFTLRQNGANTSLTVTVGASATGTFEDTTNSVALVDTDTANWAVVTGGAAGTMRIGYIGFEQAQPTPSGSIIPILRGMAVL